MLAHRHAEGDTDSSCFYFGRAKTHAHKVTSEKLATVTFPSMRQEQPALVAAAGTKAEQKGKTAAAMGQQVKGQVQSVQAQERDKNVSVTGQWDRMAGGLVQASDITEAEAQCTKLEAEVRSMKAAVRERDKRIAELHAAVQSSNSGAKAYAHYAVELEQMIQADGSENMAGLEDKNQIAKFHETATNLEAKAQAHVQYSAELERMIRAGDNEGKAALDNGNRIVKLHQAATNSEAKAQAHAHYSAELEHLLIHEWQQEAGKAPPTRKVVQTTSSMEEALQERDALIAGYKTAAQAHAHYTAEMEQAVLGGHDLLSALATAEKTIRERDAQVAILQKAATGAKLNAEAHARYSSELELTIQGTGEGMHKQAMHASGFKEFKPVGASACWVRSRCLVRPNAGGAPQWPLQYVTSQPVD